MEDAQIKLLVVASDIFEVSGRAMMARLTAGEHNPPGAGPDGPHQRTVAIPDLII